MAHPLKTSKKKAGDKLADPPKQTPAAKHVREQRAKKPAKKTVTTPAAGHPEDVYLPTGEGEDFIPGMMLVKYVKFVAEWLETGDVRKAVHAAGFNPISDKHADTLGGLLLQNPWVRTQIRDQYQAILAKTGATVERVWQEISRIAFCDPGLAFDAHGEPLPMPKIPEDVRRAISGHKTVRKTFGEDGESEEKELKFAGKDAAIEKLIRLHRMVDQDKLVIISGADFEQRMEEGRQRAAQRK